MTIAIISDSHDNLSNLKKFLSFVKKEKIKAIIHCGDVCGNETMKKLKENFKGKIYLVFGNADIKEQILEFKDNPKIEIFEDFGELEIDKIKMAFCHFFNDAKKLCQTKKYDFVFFGHTHKPWIEKTENCILANPGNLAGLYCKATFAVLDTKIKNISLKILEKI